MQEKPPPRANSAPPRELPGVPASLKNSLEKRRGSTVTSRIREREAEFAKQVQDREEQIRHLKERLRLLSQKLSDSKEKDFKFPRDRDKVVKDQQEDGFELQSIIKQVGCNLLKHISEVILMEKKVSSCMGWEFFKFFF